MPQPKQGLTGFSNAQFRLSQVVLLVGTASVLTEALSMCCSDSPQRPAGGMKPAGEGMDAL